MSTIDDYSEIDLTPEFDKGSNNITVKSEVINIKSGVAIKPNGTGPIGLSLYNTDNTTNYGWVNLSIIPEITDTVLLTSRKVGTGTKPTKLRSTLEFTVPKLTVTGTTTLNTSLTGLARLTSGVVSADKVYYNDLADELVESIYSGWIGLSEYPTSAAITSNGTTVTLTFQRYPSGDIDIVFTDGIVVVDCTPPLTIDLTVGSDVSPQINYIYIVKSDPTVLTKSTTGFPTNEEYLNIGVYLIQSAASVQTYGCYMAHPYENSIKDQVENGHLTHINAWINKQPTTWQSGCLLSPTVIIGPPDTLTFSVSSGELAQVHVTPFPTFNSSTVGDTNFTTFFCINHPTTPYLTGKNLNTSSFLRTSSNVAVSGNQTRISWVIWGAVDSTQNTKIFVNLPSGFYYDNTSATQDPNKYSDYSMPPEYSGSGFLIAKLTYRVTATGELTLVENLDLRGTIPSKIAGGASASSTTFPDNVFAIFDETDTTKKLLISVGGNTTGITTTLTSVSTSNRVLTLPNVTDTLAVLGANTFTANQTINGTANISDNIILPKASGKGIMIDNSSPTFGWKDLLGQIYPKSSGVGSPTLSEFIPGGNVRQFCYAVGEDGDGDFHIPHDYVLGTDLFFHLHWAHNGTALLEPDGIIMFHYDVTEIPTITGGTPNKPFLLFTDLHYQATNISTKQKSPNFYV